MGNFHDHVLEKGVFRRVIAYEDTVIQPYREMQARKIARTTGRGGAGNVGRPTNNHSCELRSSTLCHHFLYARLTLSSASSKGSNHGSGSFSTRSSETKSRKLTRVKTQTFTHTQMEIESEMVAGMPVPNGTQESASRPKELGVQEMWDLWWPSFRPIPKSRADATAKAHVHLRMAGLTPEVPEVPHSASTSSRPRIGAPSRAPTSSNRVVETQVRILASSHVERAIPRVPKFAPGSTEQSGLTPLSNRFQSQASSKPAARYLPEFYSPTPSNRSTGPPRQTREKKQRHHNGYMAIYSPISSFDHHESGSKQKLPPSRVLNRPHQVGSVHYPGRQTNPLPHADQLPIPGSTGDSSSSTSPHFPTRTNKRRVPLTSREKPLDMTHRGSPDVPEDARPPSPCFAPVPRRIPQRRRRVTVIL